MILAAVAALVELADETVCERCHEFVPVKSAQVMRESIPGGFKVVVRCRDRYGCTKRMVKRKKKAKRGSR